MIGSHHGVGVHGRIWNKGWQSIVDPVVEAHPWRASSLPGAAAVMGMSE